MSFNPAQLATFEETVAFRKLINFSPVFYKLKLGINPYFPQPGVAFDINTNGIYIPLWVGGPGGFVEPNSGKSLFYHYRFSNGMEGMNAGLVREKFKSFPTSPLYVLNQLLIEVQEGART